MAINAASHSVRAAEEKGAREKKKEDDAKAKTTPTKTTAAPAAKKNLVDQGTMNALQSVSGDLGAETQNRKNFMLGLKKGSPASVPVPSTAASASPGACHTPMTYQLLIISSAFSIIVQHHTCAASPSKNRLCTSDGESATKSSRGCLSSCTEAC